MGTLHQEIERIGGASSCLEDNKIPYDLLLVSVRSSGRSDLQALVHALQASTLRYLHLSRTATPCNLQECVEHECGLIEWSSCVTSEKARKCFERIFQGLWRLTKVIEQSDRLALCIIALEFFSKSPDSKELHKD